MFYYNFLLCFLYSFVQLSVGLCLPEIKISEEDFREAGVVYMFVHHVEGGVVVVDDLHPGQG